MTDNIEFEITNKVNNDKYSLFDKVMYGGLGYGYFCLPANMFKILFSILFPPLGIIINNVGEVRNEFPYIGLQNFINFFLKIDEFIISLILTALFWIPGVVYVLSKLKKDKTSYTNLNNNIITNTTTNTITNATTTEQKQTSKASFKNTRNKQKKRKVLDLDVLKKRLEI